MNTAIFSVVNAVLLRPLPYHQPDRLIQVNAVDRRTGGTVRASVLDFLDLRTQSQGRDISWDDRLDSRW